jgi:radical SAM protein with 4Fe4S-binding SPASM domain
VRLSGIGEPLVNPHFFSLVDILAERGVKCDFITNGTLLTPGRSDAILSRHNIEEVVISCDGAQKESFESLRLGADFESWKQLVGQFVAEARQRRHQTLCISSSVVISKQNLNELGEIIRLASGLGFDAVTILVPVPVDDVAASLCPSQVEMSTIREEDLFELATALGVGLSYRPRRPALLPKRMLRCLQPWEYIFIRTDGAVAPCCALFGSDKGAVMGNVFQQDFMEIWGGDRFREFRRTSALGTNCLCLVCPYY